MNKIIKSAVISLTVLIILGVAEGIFNDSATVESIRQKAKIAGKAKVKDTKNIFIERYLPIDYKLETADRISFRSEDLNGAVYARHFEQGDASYIEFVPIDSSKIKKLKAYFNGREIIMTEKDFGYAGLFAISPEESIDVSTISYSYDYYGQEITSQFVVPVKKRYFRTFTGVLDLKEQSDADYLKDPAIRKMIEDNTVKKKAVFKAKSRDMIDAVISHPRDFEYITSTYWESRLYKQYKKSGGKITVLPPSKNTHRGLDFRGKEGEDVYAMMRGRVAIAEKMYYEGNFTVIDHGNRVFSYYMHQSKLIVNPGDIVESGQKIGEVGSTGRSTASHLHVSVSINGVQVDPLSLLCLPVR